MTKDTMGFYSKAFSKRFEKDRRPLKRFTSEQLEASLEGALQELTGSRYIVSISKTDFHPDVWFKDEAELVLKVSRCQEELTSEFADAMAEEREEQKSV